MNGLRKCDTHNGVLFHMQEIDTNISSIMKNRLHEEGEEG
jgi:hypothetical protein